MTLRFRWCSLGFFSLFLGAWFATAAEPLRLVMQDGGWGGAPTNNIRAVLLSAGGEIWRHCPHTRLAEIRVHHRGDYPQTNWERGKDGCIVIGLNTSDTYWAQYAYQFAHEFCHALATHSGDWEIKWRAGGKPNHWLEESLCETASLFALRAMGRAWVKSPPYSNWKSFAPALTNYAQQRLDEPKHKLPPDTEFPAWFRAEEASLRAHSTQREKNGIIAAQLLPLFEAEPRGWETVTFLNLGTRDKKMSLAAFLAEWQMNVSPELRPFVAKVAMVFGVTL